MRRWEGMRDDESEIGSGLADLVNVSLYIDGEVRWRPGLWNRMDSGGLAISELYDHVDGVHAVHVVDDGTITSTAPADGSTVNELKTGYNVAKVPTVARSSGRVYISNDFDPMQVVDNATGTAVAAGIDVPASAPGAPSTAAGNVPVGDHLVRYRYYNSKTGYFSSPSDASTVTVSSSAKSLEFSITASGGGGDLIRSADTKVDQIIVQMTLADGTKYFDALFVNQTESAATVNLTDDALSQQTITGENAGSDAEPPPLFLNVVEHRKRLFGIGATTRSITGTFTDTSTTVSGSGYSAEWAGRVVRVAGSSTEYRIASATSTALTLSTAWSGSTGSKTAYVYSARPDLLYWSQPGLPEHWKPTAFARRVFSDETDTPTAMASFYGTLYIFALARTAVLAFESDPSGGQLAEIPTDMGAFSQACIVKANGRMFGLGPSGAWEMVGTQPRHISKPIDSTLRERWDATEGFKFHGVFEPTERVIYWFYVADGDTEPKEAICYDVDGKRWYRATFAQAITCSGHVRDQNGEVRACLGDTNGYSWYLKAGFFDGIQSGQDAVVTADAGATTTVIPVNETLQTIHPDLKGVTAYHVGSGESRRITSNTSSAITVTPAFSAAPAEDDEIYLGRISAEVVEKWTTAQDLAIKARAGRSMVAFVPSSSGKAKIYTYKDFEANALTCTASDQDVYPDGVTVTNGLTYVEVDFDGGSGDGFEPVPGFSQFARSWRLKLVADRPEGTLQLLQLGILFERKDAHRDLNE